MATEANAKSSTLIHNTGRKQTCGSMHILKVIKSKFTLDVLAIREDLDGPDGLMLLLAAVVNPHL